MLDFEWLKNFEYVFKQYSLIKRENKQKQVSFIYYFYFDCPWDHIEKNRWLRTTLPHQSIIIVGNPAAGKILI